MQTTQSDKNLFDKVRSFLATAENFTIFAPYIQSGLLMNLLKGHNGHLTNTIITSWKPQDVALGISDIEVYNFCKDFEITLLVNNRIHLKAYTINEFASCYITSSNISKKGLAVGANHNYELGVFVDQLGIKDRIYFDQIIEEAEEVTQSYYEQVKEQVDKLVLKKDMIKDFDIKSEGAAKSYLLTALPMSDSVEALSDIYQGNDKNLSEDMIRSCEHDIRLYQIPRNLKDKDFKSHLKEAYFNHRFIKDFLKFNGEGKHFGELTSWLHDHCTSVPTPRRFEIKEALQRVFKFTVALSEGEYEALVPYRRSQKLSKRKGKNS
jgi:hypothetical protein